MASLLTTFFLFQVFVISVFTSPYDRGGALASGPVVGGSAAPGPDVAAAPGPVDSNTHGKSDYAKPEIKTNYKGAWAIDNRNVGVCAMQLQLMPNDQVIWYDATSLVPSACKLEPKGNCLINPDANNISDCWAHALSYDLKTSKSRTVKLRGAPWCSSGNLNGSMVATGGTLSGLKVVRMMPMDDLRADFSEKRDALGDFRWYSSNQILEYGTAIVEGGREAFSYKIVPPSLEFQPKNIDLPFLKETCTPAKGPNVYIKNNLYPFLFLLTDGNVFLFVNNRAITLNPTSGWIIQEHPVCPGGSRNYPTSGNSAILPLKMSSDNTRALTVEIVICGGNKPDAFEKVDVKHVTYKGKEFIPALKDC